MVKSLPAGDPGSISVSFVPAPSFLADSEGHTGWGDSGGGGFGFSSCLHDIPGPWNILCYALTPISSPFLVATLGLQGFPGMLRW